MSTLVLKYESKNEERLRLQEICVYCYITLHLVDGVYKQANQFTANAVLDGERKTAERTIQRLIDKELLIVVTPAVSNKGWHTPAVLRPVPGHVFWRFYWKERSKTEVSNDPGSPLDKPRRVSNVKAGKVSNGTSVEKNGTSVPKDAASCPTAKPVGRVLNDSALLTTFTGHCIKGQQEHCVPEHGRVSNGRESKWWCDDCGDALDSPHHRMVCGKVGA